MNILRENQNLSDFPTVYESHTCECWMGLRISKISKLYLTFNHCKLRIEDHFHICPNPHCLRLEYKACLHSLWSQCPQENLAQPNTASWQLEVSAFIMLFGQVTADNGFPQLSATHTSAPTLGKNYLYSEFTQIFIYIPTCLFGEAQKQSVRLRCRGGNWGKCHPFHTHTSFIH